jgi:hypothetical protein
VGRAIDWTSDGPDNGTTAKSLISWLCSEYEDEFVEVAQEQGLSTSLSKKMGANFWTAMSEACNLDTTTQRKLNTYMSYHYGGRVSVPEREIRVVGNDFIPFETFELQIGGKRLLYAYRDVDTMLNNYINTASALSDLEDVSHLELALGGDYGKGAFTFLAVVFIRYSNEKKCNIFEMQVGQIDSASDSAEILKPLLAKHEVGLQRMKPDVNETVS